MLKSGEHARPQRKTVEQHMHLFLAESGTLYAPVTAAIFIGFASHF